MRGEDQTCTENIKPFNAEENLKQLKKHPTPYSCKQVVWIIITDIYVRHYFSRIIRIE